MKIRINDDNNNNKTEKKNVILRVDGTWDMRMCRKSAILREQNYSVIFIWRNSWIFSIVLGERASRTQSGYVIQYSYLIL